MQQRAGVCPDDEIPEPVGVAVPLTPDDFQIPRRRCFTPRELAPYLMISSDTVIRMIEDGMLRAVRIRGAYKIPWVEIVSFFARQQRAFN